MNDKMEVDIRAEGHPGPMKIQLSAQDTREACQHEHRFRHMEGGFEECYACQLEARDALIAALRAKVRQLEEQLSLIGRHADGITSAIVKIQASERQKGNYGTE